MNFLLKASVMFPLVIVPAGIAQAQSAPTSLLTSAIVADGDAPLAQTDVATSPSTVDFDILSCPFAIFREAYLGVFETPDRLAVMALEDEAISACAKRQTQVNLVLKQEKELRELLEQTERAGSQDITERANAIVDTSIEASVDAQALQSQGRAGDAPINEGDEESPAAQDAGVDQAAQTALIAQMKRAVKEAQDSCTFQYGVQSAGHQVDGDGNFGWATLTSSSGETFVVKVGDLLPGDLRVSKVSKDTVFIQGSDGSSRELPIAPFEHAEVIDMNFNYKLVPNDQAAISEPLDANSAQAGQ